ncbi:MAG: pteridine reductase [Rhodocyclaceae bacterium]|nr:pteridine reductase [Rhodocyclaceae bacterium]MBK6554509.1 pteridine reductase [Rhodocyclaceae bacterium]MBK6677553.1 pteridine reductase [Rhodocyclaceae bacterium]MBK9310211.1 pteridine reductase [Rhodocyclaceae bacterium]MBK9954716.1 pteridine reductase [Rhodocyclaceae bacterium]
MNAVAQQSRTAPVALITGGARRIGAAIARVLHDAGIDIALHYRASADAAYALADELNRLRPGSATALAAALGDPSAAEQLVAATGEHFGRLDILVNNASTFFATPIGSIDVAAWDDLTGSNLRGPLFLAQAAVQRLATADFPGGGCVVNITDIHAERPLKGYPVYCAAKAGLLGLTRSLAVELAPGVRVNAVAPGAIAWPEQGDDFSEAERATIVDHTLLKRIGSPHDIALAVRFLVLDAPYVTGQVINVDGGRTARL